MDRVVPRPGVSSTLLHFGSPSDHRHKDTKAQQCLFGVMNSILGTVEGDIKFSATHRANLSSQTLALTKEPFPLLSFGLYFVPECPAEVWYI